MKLFPAPLKAFSVLVLVRSSVLKPTRDVLSASVFFNLKYN